MDVSSRKEHCHTWLKNVVSVDRTGDRQAYGKSVQLVDLETLENGVTELERRYARKKYEQSMV
jgi:hypothetical protein